VPLTRKISICISIERVIRFWLQNKTLMSGEVEIATDVFHSFLMKKTRLVKNLAH